MRGGRALESNNADAVVNAYKHALVNGKAELAKQIKEANPELAARLQ